MPTLNKKFGFSGLCLFLIAGIILSLFLLEDARAAPLADLEALVLYDAVSGTVPAAPLMTFTDFPPGVAQPVFLSGSTIMDTTASGRDTYAGWVSSQAATPGFPDLDRAAGFQMDFSLQVESESHRSSDRSGFSLIVLDQGARGIELAFWENEIWAQSDSSTGGLFQHAEGVVFPTTADMVDYQLNITGDIYTLTADSQAILTGPVRDYSDFDGLPNPYRAPNFLFLGDNTTSAQARVRLDYVSVTGSEPVLPTNTDISPPAVSLTPLPNVTPVPSPTPARRMTELCPSGGLILALTVAHALIARASSKHVS